MRTDGDDALIERSIALIWTSCSKLGTHGDSSSTRPSFFTMTVSSKSVALTVFVSLIAVTLVDAFAFSPSPPKTKGTCLPPPLSAIRNHNREPFVLSRTDFLSTSLFSLVFVNYQSVNAAESIAPCKVVGGGKPNNCISTSSVRQVDCYAPPWTFEVSEEEAMARLKGVIASDPSLELMEEVPPNYVKVRAVRGRGVTDELEFLINAQYKVVMFRSAEAGEEPNVGDFGANRKRLEDIRKKASVFGVMGEGLTADSYGDRGTGPLQQLKAFYGLQSGGGYEEIFEDE